MKYFARGNTQDMFLPNFIKTQKFESIWVQYIRFIFTVTQYNKHRKYDLLL